MYNNCHGRPKDLGRQGREHNAHSMRLLGDTLCKQNLGLLQATVQGPLQHSPVSRGREKHLSTLFALQITDRVGQENSENSRDEIMGRLMPQNRVRESDGKRKHGR